MSKELLRENGYIQYYAMTYSKSPDHESRTVRSTLWEGDY